MGFMKKCTVFMLILLLSTFFLSGCVIPEKDSQKMHVAMITDAGNITDQSFNQQVYEACAAYSKKNNVDFTYKKPEKNTTVDIVSMVDLAVAEGYNVIILMGNNFAKSIAILTSKYPDIKFIGADVEEKHILEQMVGVEYDKHPEKYKIDDYLYRDNLYIANYSSEISGFLAGYAAVMAGYRNLGFLGGQAVQGVILYGYGYLQGIEAAAEALGVTDDVSVEYAYAGQFFGSAEITAVMDTWFSKGTQIVFSAGGGIYTSVAESAVKYGGKMIGVDTDQSVVIDSYQKGLTFTSAMKRLDVTVDTVLEAIQNGRWDEYRGRIDVVGLDSGTDQEKNQIGLPMDTTKWCKNFTKDDYYEILQKILSGEIKVSASAVKRPQVSFHLKERKGTIQ